MRRTSSAATPGSETAPGSDPSPRTDQVFDEINVFEGVAERTGIRVDRTAIRGRSGACRSVTELSQKIRRLGDGYYYLAARLWPGDTTRLVLHESWRPLR
jgi:hypothetical protein